MLQREPLNKILPGVETIEQAVEAYQRFYTKEQEQQFGVVAMEVERVKL